MTGMFVTIDALDGVGKTTLVQGLAKRLGGIAMHTPGPILRRCADEVLSEIGESQAARCLFYTLSVLAEGARARARADQGALVVMDRYWGSTLAYARARGVAIDLSSIASIVPKPDLSILLVLDEDERARRLALRGNLTPEDAETFSVEFRNIVVHHLRQATDLEIDITGADPQKAVERVATLILHATGESNAHTCSAHIALP